MSALSPDSSAALAEEVRALRQLFQRRLLEDRAKNALIDTVQTHLAERAALDSGEAFRGLIAEALLAVDRLIFEDSSADLSMSVAAELLEIFARRGLRPVPTTGIADPRIHEIAGMVSAAVAGTDPATGAGEIVEVRRRGYTLGERLVRPAVVLVAADDDD